MIIIVYVYENFNKSIKNIYTLFYVYGVLAMSDCGDTLHKLYKDQKKFQWFCPDIFTITELFWEYAKSLKILHDQLKKTHNDIKPSN